MARLVAVGAGGPAGLAAYAMIVTEPRYLRSLVSTVVLAALVTALTLVIATIAGVFLERNRFPGRSLLVAMLTFPLAFPGVVVGFMVIMLAGRQGLIGDLTRWVTAAEKLDRRLEEAARSLGASAWQVIRDVIVPGLRPAFLSAGAICFATAMGAFGTAFTLATEIEVLPMTIYTEFTLRANIVVAAALSIILGGITWLALALARSAAGSSVAASA